MFITNKGKITYTDNTWKTSRHHNAEMPLDDPFRQIQIDQPSDFLAKLTFWSKFSKLRPLSKKTKQNKTKKKRENPYYRHLSLRWLSCKFSILNSKLHVVGCHFFFDLFDQKSVFFAIFLKSRNFQQIWMPKMDSMSQSHSRNA